MNWDIPVYSLPMDKSHIPRHWQEMCPQDFTYTDKPRGFLDRAVQFLETEGFRFHVEPYMEGHLLHCDQSPLQVCGVYQKGEIE